MSKDRIVVTGMGLVTPLGCGVDAVWQRLLEGKSGIGINDRVDCSDLPAKIAGLVPDIRSDPSGIDIENVVSVRDRRKVDLFTVYALAAAEEALTQADWKPQDEQLRNRTGTIIATGIGGFPVITEAVHTLEQKGPRRLSPFVIPAFLANLAAGNVSIRYGFKGPIGTPVTACAAGLQAIGDAMRIIRSGEADVIVAGGTDACIDRLCIGGFSAARALSTRNDAPEQASRPFDRDRDGFVLGEGAGIVVLETLEHALARGATPLVEISGYGTSADAWHLTAGPEDGSGAARAVQACMAMAGASPDDIGYVNAHATSTHVGDRGEIAALRTVFGDAIGKLAISSTKSAIGHLLGAAGGVEAVFTALAIRTGMLPPTLNCDHPEDDFADLDFVPHEARSVDIRAALCNGFGFGGVNATVAMARLD
ncbi:beta-ketoacyl-ACP synthase II [Nitratireductor sp. XY-223]|uniref:beta-ketoacyl-ACP synthase II n=1 Tax=Nitratireductor sp. XY-223 TaxID=2561926 RepID=UPI0010AAAE7C|nr:beta-ketoacyl-ACP synthase II [Nitratireductor sp. XY-223]